MRMVDDTADEGFGDWDWLAAGLADGGAPSSMRKKRVG